MAPTAPNPTGPIVQLSEERELAELASIYASLQFAPPDPEIDECWGIRSDESLVAVGRVRRLEPGEWEVGGFWTDPALRGRGLAARLVEHTMACVPTGERGWCLPLVQLVDYYGRFGMRAPAPDANVPCAVAARSNACTESGHRAALLTFEGTARRG